MTKSHPEGYASDWQTHPKVALAIVRALAADRELWPGMRIAELHCGEGSFLKALIIVYDELGWERPQIHASDLVLHDSLIPWAEEHGVSLEKANALHLHFDADIVIGNPPYSEMGGRTCIAHEHVEHALTIAPTVIMLVRVGLLTTSAKRVQWAVHDRPVSVRYELTPRPPFKRPGEECKGKTDACEYVVGVWRRKKPHMGRAVSIPLDWRAGCTKRM